MIQVFSKRDDKPHHYGFADMVNPPFDPIEFAISIDEGKTWTSCYDVPSINGVLCYRAPDVQVAKRTDNTKKLGLSDGSRLMSTTYDSRQLKIELMYNGINEKDAMLAFEAAQRFLVARDPYWITFSNWSNRMYYGTASMGEVTYSDERHWTCEVTFTDLIGLSRSIGTSQQYPDDVWGVNSNLPEGIDPQYTFTNSDFDVYNLSDVLIDPERRGHQFKLICQGQSSGNLKITNKTTGDVLTKASAFNGTFVLDGVNPKLNNEGCLLDTNCGVLTLEIGKNEFHIENFVGKVMFDFPMWWLS